MPSILEFCRKYWGRPEGIRQYNWEEVIDFLRLVPGERVAFGPFYGHGGTDVRRTLHNKLFFDVIGDKVEDYCYVIAWYPT